MDVQFVAGKKLSSELAAIVEPALRELFPQVRFALAFIGPGSDVLGYDTARSMDHDWGPRLTIVVPDERCDDVIARINAGIEQFLPSDIAGFPTRFSLHADGTTFPDAHGSIHRLNVTSVRKIVHDALLIDDISHLNDATWLSTPMQSLLEVTSGEVFVDDAGELTRLRAGLAFYPEHVLRYQLAALWMRVSQIQPFVGRTGEVGDEVGSATITASIVRDLMRIGLLQSGQYAPYAKWLGTAFASTHIGGDVLRDLRFALDAVDWQDREAGINRAGSQLIRQLNSLSLIAAMPEATARFHTRPFHVLPAESIAHALQTSLAKSSLALLPPFVGSIDLVTDSTDALKSPMFRRAFCSMIQSYLR